MTEDVILKGFNDEVHKTYVGKVYLEDGWYSINDLQMVIKHLEKMNKINKLMMRKMNNGRKQIFNAYICVY